MKLGLKIAVFFNLPIPSSHIMTLGLAQFCQFLYKYNIRISIC
jgi:hypothetical protein